MKRTIVRLMIVIFGWTITAVSMNHANGIFRINEEALRAQKRHQRIKKCSHIDPKHRQDNRNGLKLQYLFLRDLENSLKRPTMASERPLYLVCPIISFMILVFNLHSLTIIFYWRHTNFLLRTYNWIVIYKNTWNNLLHYHNWTWST